MILTLVEVRASCRLDGEEGGVSTGCLLLANSELRFLWM